MVYIRWKKRMCDMVVQRMGSRYEVKVCFCMRWDFSNGDGDPSTDKGKS